MYRDFGEQDADMTKTAGEANGETKGLAGWFDKKKMQGKKLRKDQLLIMLLSGVLLMIIAFPVGGTGNKKTGAQEDNGKNNLWENGEAGSILARGDAGDGVIDETNTNKPDSLNSYITELETKLEQMLFNMENVGKVDVLITLQSSEEKIVEKDIPINRSNTEEQDSGGGSRSVSNVDTQEITIYETDSGKSTPYVVKTTSPKVEGVVVVCEGAGIGSVSKNITDAIEVLFGIEPHKIKVVKMKTS